MSLNDPNWGRQGGSRGPGGNQGPPDLDELWRNFNRKLNELFGGRRGGGSDLPPRPPSGKALGGGAGVLIALVVAVWLASGFYVVDAASKGVVLTFGRYTEQTDPGLRWRMPFPFQSHEIVNLSQVRTIEIGYRNNVRTKVLKESLMLTDDENIVDLQFAVQYVVTDAQAWLFNNRSPEDVAMQTAEATMREVIGKSRMDAILYEQQDTVANQAQVLMQRVLDGYRTGIDVSRVTIQNAQPPEQVQAAFDDAVKAGQDRERQKNEGEAYANDVIPKARGTASRLKEEAEGYRARVIANSEGDASRFRQVLVEYAKAPAITRERIYIETLQQVLSSTSKIVMDYKQGGNLLYLPLDKLMQQAGAAGAAAQSPLPGMDTPLPADPGPRSRESLRSRERGER
jgi:modulator of FtsH protease HflK